MKNSENSKALWISPVAQEFEVDRSINILMDSRGGGGAGDMNSLHPETYSTRSEEDVNPFSYNPFATE